MNANLSDTSDGLARKGEQVRLTFTTRGLGPRDELLVKSLIRLLDHKTHHQWVYTEEGADLNVLGADFMPSNGVSLEEDRGLHRLWLGHLNRSAPNFLQLPLRPVALEQMLNSLGAKILSSRSAAKTLPSGSDMQFRLVKWPPATLVSTPERIKLATMLAGKPMSLAVMAQRAGLPIAACTQFCDELRQLELLQALDQMHMAASDIQGTSGGSDQQGQTPQRLDIVSRIRLRLGLMPTVTR